MTTNLPARVESLPAVKSQGELSQALQHLQNDYNILVPAQMNFSSPLHKVSLEAVQLDPTTDDKGNGVDFYKPSGGGDKFTLHYRAILKLAAAAGVQMHDGHIVTRECDKDGRATYVEYIQGWSVKRVNGSMRRGESTGTYKWEEEKRGPNLNQAEKARRFAEQRAESNAKLRAMFDALDMLPRGFSLPEMKKAFLVPCVVEDFADMIKDDPEAKRMVIAHSLGISDQIFGPRQSPASGAELKLAQGATAEVVEEHIDKSTGEITQAAKVVELPRPTETEYKSSWMSAKPAERLAEIAKMIETRGFTPKAGSRTPDQLTPEEQVGYMFYLYSLPMKPAQAPLPWGNGQ